MPYPAKTVSSATHVVRFVKPNIRYAYEHGDGMALSIDSSDYTDYYEGKDTLFWWHPNFADFEMEEIEHSPETIQDFTYTSTMEIRIMNEFLNLAYDKGLITLIPFLTEDDAGKFFIQVEDRFTYRALAEQYFL